jgi:exopolyphosphatase/guanosine-5'-triphosphate,3'-diphosphate pyrophosphatase
MKPGSESLAEIDAARRWMLSFGWFPQHMEQVARLSCCIFDQLKPLHGLEKRWRTILEAAALVHDVGWTISQKAHHKHAARLVRQNHLPGFSAQEQDLIALLVRYHRKASPRTSHGRFSRLDAKTQSGIRNVVALLRIADGLDRTHLSAVQSIACRIEAGQVTFRLHMTHMSAEDISAGHKKARFFEEVFGRRVRFEPILAEETDGSA